MAAASSRALPPPRVSSSVAHTKQRKEGRGGGVCARGKARGWSGGKRKSGREQQGRKGKLWCDAASEDGTVAASVATGRSLYKPSSSQRMVEDASGALTRALESGQRCLEVQMPSLPGGLEMEQRGSSDDFQAANIRLALAVAKRLDRTRYVDVALVLPDEGEKRFYGKQMRNVLDYIPGARFEALTDVRSGGIGGFLSSIMSVAAGDEASGSEKKKPADIYFFVNASTVELPLMRTFIEEKLGSEIPAVTFNLELDTLRSDLGTVMEETFVEKHTHKYIYIYIYMNMWLAHICMCACSVLILFCFP